MDLQYLLPVTILFIATFLIIFLITFVSKKGKQKSIATFGTVLLVIVSFFLIMSVISLSQQ